MRDYKNEQYRRWRNKIRRRDGRVCRWPGCNCTKNLHAHHILPWAQFPHLRLIDSNGITLCAAHHKMVRGSELNYAEFFQTLLRNDEYVRGTSGHAGTNSVGNKKRKDK